MGVVTFLVEEAFQEAVVVLCPIRALEGLEVEASVGVCLVNPYEMVLGVDAAPMAGSDLDLEALGEQGPFQDVVEEEHSMGVVELLRAALARVG